MARLRPLHRDSDTPRLQVEVLPRLELPPVDTEAGVLARMLLSENAGPAHESFANQTEAHEAMRWMVNVLKNRLKLGSQHFSAGRQATTLKELIKAPNQ